MHGLKTFALKPSLEPARLVVYSFPLSVVGKWGPLGARRPSQVLVVTELRELVFHLERPTCKHTGGCVRSILAFLASPRVCWSRHEHLIALS